MDKNKRLAVWLPVIIALSIALGIFVGNHYLRLTQGKRHIYSSGNKINAILDIIDEQYVDTVDMKQLVEDAIPKVFSELDRTVLRTTQSLHDDFLVTFVAGIQGVVDRVYTGKGRPTGK